MRPVVSKEQTDQSRSSRNPRKQVVSGDFNAELGPGVGSEHLSVGPYTLKDSNMRGDCMKQWMMLKKFVALNTVYRKVLDKQASYRTPKVAEKQLDYILINRKYLKPSGNAEANDMIHKGSDRRSVMAQFVTPRQKRNTPEKVALLEGRTQ